MAEMAPEEVFEEMCRDLGGEFFKEEKHSRDYSHYSVCEIDNLDDLKTLTNWMHNLRQHGTMPSNPLMVMADFRFSNYHEQWVASLEVSRRLDFHVIRDEHVASPMEMQSWIIGELKERGIPEDEAEDIAVQMDYDEIFDKTTSIRALEDAPGFLRDATDIEVRQDHATDAYHVKAVVDYDHPEHAVLSHAVDEIDETVREVADKGQMLFHKASREEFDEAVGQVA